MWHNGNDADADDAGHGEPDAEAVDPAGPGLGYTFSSLSLRQHVWGTKGTIALNVNDPLDLMKFNSSSSDATYTQTSRSSWRERMAMLAVTYNFGKPPQQQSRRSGPEEAGETIRVR
jgi:hypothetical protein